MTITTKVVEVFHVSDLNNEVLDECTMDIVSSHESGIERNQRMADAMSCAFGGQWYSAEGLVKKAVGIRRKDFISRFPNAGTGTKYWADIKKAAGHVPKEIASASTTIDAKNLKELATILGRIFKAEDDDTGAIFSQKARRDLSNAFEAMGGNLLEVEGKSAE